MPVNALHEKHTYIYNKSLYEASSGACMYVCVQKAQQIVHKKQLNFEIQVQGQMTTVF